MSFDADVTACAAIVEKADPDRFAAVMASPVAARAVLFVLYAFNVEVSRAPWLTQETMIAEMRLQWWRDVLEEIGQGAQVRRHEVVTPLSGFLSEPATQVLDRLVAARRWDIYKDAFEDAAHFDNYLNETAAGLMWVAACALDPDLTPQGDAEAMVRACGRATGLARFLQAVPALEAHSRIPLVDGRAEAIADLARAALDALPAPKLLKRTLGDAAKPAIIEAFATRSLLKQVVQDPRRVAVGDLQVHPMRRAALLWRWS